jgi:hypothetical protein
MMTVMAVCSLRRQLELATERSGREQVDDEEKEEHG